MRLERREVFAPKLLLQSEMPVRWHCNTLQTGFAELLQGVVVVSVSKLQRNFSFRKYQNIWRGVK